MSATKWPPRVVAFILVGVLLGSAFVPPWELFHDELYYWAGAQRLEFGYVDHPPLAPWLLRIFTAIFGDGPLGFRIAPALCAAGTVLLTAGMARRFGAGVWGQTVAGLAAATAPVFLTFFSFYSVNAFELLLWSAICFALIVRIDTDNEKLWLLIGVLVGLAALNKHTVVLLVGALAVGIAASQWRSDLRHRWIWLGAAIALAIALPNLLWNYINDFPSLSFYLSRSGGILPATLGQAIEIQLVTTNPATLLLWLPGAAFLLASKRMRPYRPLGIAFVILFVAISFSGQRRGDRIAGIYPVAFAAGAAFWHQWQGRAAPVARGAIATLILGLGVVLAPASLTLLSPERVEAFFKTIDERPAIETGDVDQWLPLTLLGRLEWRRFSEEVYAAVDALPEMERSRAVILTPHWLYASVLEYYGRERDGPPVVSPHNAYYFWREAAVGRDRVIAVAIPHEITERYFEVVRPLALFECEQCTHWRPDLPVQLAYGGERSLAEWLEQWRTFAIGGAPELTP